MKHRLQQWLPFFIGGVVLGWYLYRVDWQAMFRALQAVNYWWIVPIVGFNLLSLLFRAFRWQVFLASTKRIGLYTLWNVTAIGFMLNCILPGRLGEILKPFVLKRKEGVSFSAALGTCFTERVYDLTAVILILAGSLLVVPISPKLTVPLTTQKTGPHAVTFSQIRGESEGSSVSLQSGRVQLGGVAGEVVSATGELRGDQLLITESLVRFATGSVRLENGTVATAAEGARSGARTILISQAYGEMTAQPVIEVRKFVRSGGIASGIACAGVIVVILLLAYAREFCMSVAEWIFGLLARLAGRASGRDLDLLREKAVASVRKFAEALSIFHQPLPFLMTLLHTALIWCSIMLTEYLLFVAFDLAEVGVTGAFLLMSILALSVAAPQLPGYLGVFQVACIVTLAILGIHAVGIPDAYANLLWMVQVLPVILVGFVSLRLEGMSLAQVRKLENEALPEKNETCSG